MAYFSEEQGHFVARQTHATAAEGEATMPSRTQRKRWQGVKKQDIALENALRAYLLHHEDRNHSAKTVRCTATC